MSHPEQLAFIKMLYTKNRGAFADARVLEIGSFDVYGSVRTVVGQVSEYVGIDLAPGPGVDVIASGHNIPKDLGNFDVVISSESLEHDLDWRRTIESAIAVLKPGGLIGITCASIGRPEHGTSRTDPKESPGSQSIGWDHYANISSIEMEEFLQSLGVLADLSIWYNKRVFDLYVCAIKRSCQAEERSTLPFSLITNVEVQSIVRSTPLVYLVARLPIRFMLGIVGTDAGETFARKYWQALRRMFPSATRTLS